MKTLWNKLQPSVHVRWMIRKDMPAVLVIEQRFFEFDWSEDDFIRCLRQRNCIGMVAEIDNKVVCYMIYELHKNRLHLLRLAVDPAHQRQKVGSAMVAKLRSKLSYDQRNRIMLEVRESNLAGQMFFRSQGFKAIQILRGFYGDTREDAYLMQLRYVEGEV
jgi:ribosomal-protein-alanine N-acetyltransferase